MYSFSIVIGVLLLTAVTSGSPGSRQRSNCPNDRAPCEDIISRLGSDYSPCDTMKRYVKCLNDNYNDLEDYTRRCRSRRSVFDKGQSRVREMIDIYREEQDRLCNMNTQDARRAAQCISSTDSSRCFYSTASRYGFSPRDIETRTDRTPSVKDFCRFIREASDCLEDEIVSRCRDEGDKVRRLAESVAEQVYRIPFDYRQNCKNNKNGDDDDEDRNSLNNLLGTVLRFE